MFDKFFVHVLSKACKIIFDMSIEYSIFTM